MLDDVLKKIEEADAETAEPATPEGDQPAEEGATEAEVEEKKRETVTYAEEVEDDEPEAEEEQAPEPISISDDAVVADPFNPGQTITGRELKDRMLMQADYTRKTQELAEMRKALEARQPDDEYEDEEEEEQDDFSALDPDDPLVRKMRETERALAEMRQQNEQLIQAVTSQQAERDRELLERTERSLMEKFPILDQKQLDVAGHLYLAAIQRGDAVTYEKVVEAHAKELEARDRRVIEGWKEKHRVKPPAEPEGGPAATPGGKGPTRHDLMGEGLAELIAKEDAEMARQANK